MAEYKKANFAGGCFWCMVQPFEERDGIVSVVSGYTGGHTENPTYEEVCSNTTGHTEAVQITYDPNVVSYEDLVNVYWQQTDPTDAGGQFVDRGDSYRPVIYYSNDEEKQIAEASKKQLDESGRFKDPVVTSIEEREVFYPAEEYHQDFHKKNSAHYKRYRQGSGRQAFIDNNWE